MQCAAFCHHGCDCVSIRDWTTYGMGGAQPAIPTFSPSPQAHGPAAVCWVTATCGVKPCTSNPSHLMRQNASRACRVPFLHCISTGSDCQGLHPAAHWHEAEIPLSVTSLRDTESNKIMLSTSYTFVIMDCFGLLHMCNQMLLLFTCYRSLCLN